MSTGSIALPPGNERKHVKKEEPTHIVVAVFWTSKFNRQAKIRHRSWTFGVPHSKRWSILYYAIPHGKTPLHPFLFWSASATTFPSLFLCCLPACPHGWLVSLSSWSFSSTWSHECVREALHVPSAERKPLSPARLIPKRASKVSREANVNQAQKGHEWLTSMKQTIKRNKDHAEKNKMQA